MAQRHGHFMAGNGVHFSNGILTTMAIEKLKLDLGLVLPQIPVERDSCVERLISLLKSRNIYRSIRSIRSCRMLDLLKQTDKVKIGLSKNIRGQRGSLVGGGSHLNATAIRVWAITMRQLL